ncbi:MAG TPA: methyltransferase domain-containing protein [Acidimicrobiales bacterium]|nr:methyltransferase domain-containing protein [Acidimicrobiales bacterium]
MPGRNVRLRELLLGVEGLALLRNLFEGTDAEAARRVAEVRRLLDDDAFDVVEPTEEADARSGYAVWSATYDDPENLIIALEEPAVWGVIEPLPPGRALDAACGTGRHARRLIEMGHTVTGVDITTEMLEVARGAVPGATFDEGDLTALPYDDGSFDVIVCGLAIAHVADLDSAIAELARVLAPRGHLVISALHPFQALLGWHAPFKDGEGQRRFVREHPHTHADYLVAFDAAGLVVRHCIEPVLTEDSVQAKRRAFRHIRDATLAAYLGLPAVLVWHVEARPSV